MSHPEHSNSHPESNIHNHTHTAEATHDHNHTHTTEPMYDHNHTHDDAHPHPHEHSHTQTRAVVNRLSRAIGHLESVKRMVENGQDCADVLIQLAAVKSAINNTGKIILKDHIEHCLVDAIEHGDEASIESLNKAIDQFIK